MPNGGDPEKCAKARPFYDEIRPILESYALQCKLTFIPWYHEEPTFMLEWEDSSDGLARCIQIYITPDGTQAGMSIFAVAYKDYGVANIQEHVEYIQKHGKPPERRIKNYFVTKGMLPRDKERILPSLRVAMTLLTATREEDLLAAEKWQEAWKAHVPVFDFGA